MLDQSSLSLWAVFLAGLFSFFSSCVVPLLPTYFSLLTGVSVSTVNHRNERNLLLNAVAFLAGLSLLFIILGLTASTLGRFLISNREFIRQVSGVIIIVFGLHLVGLLKLKLLQREKRLFHIPHTPTPINSFFLGIAFSAGWTPCIGPTLGSVLLLASNSSTIQSGGYLLLIYSIGFSLPFLLIAAFSKPAISLLKRWKRFLPIIEKVNGVFMIMLGVIIYFDYFSWLTSIVDFGTHI